MEREEEFRILRKMKKYIYAYVSHKDSCDSRNTYLRHGDVTHKPCSCGLNNLMEWEYKGHPFDRRNNV